MADAPKPDIVEVLLYKGKNTFTGKKITAKVYGGIVTAKELNNTHPVIWLGQQSYTTLNLQNKRNMLYYDTLTHMLFRPSEMAMGSDNIDMIAQATQNTIVGSENAKLALGVNDAKNSTATVAIAAMVLIFLLAGVIAYLELSTAHAPASATTPSTNGSGGVPSTTGLVPGGPSIVPTANGTT